MMDEDMEFKQLMNVFDDPNMLDHDAVFDNGFQNNLKRRRSRFSGCFASMGNDVKTVKDQHLLTTRLRRASEVHTSGLLSKEEKDSLKEMLLSRDPKFSQEFDQAHQTGNWDTIRQKLHRPRTNSLTPRRSSLLMAIMDQREDDDFLNVGEDHDLSAVFDSTGLDLSNDDLKSGFMLRQGTDLSVAKRNSLLATAKNLLNKKDNDVNNSANMHNSLAMSKRNSLLMPQPQKKGRAMAAIPENSKSNTTTETKSGEAPPEVPKPRGRGRPKGSGKGRGSNKPRGTGKKSSGRGRGGYHGSAVTKTMGYNMPPTSSFYPPSNVKKEGHNMLNGVDLDKHAKFRKNERERRRRLVVSKGFNELVSVLNLGDAAKVDKATVLNTSVKKIRMLEKRVQALEAENLDLKNKMKNMSKGA